MTTKATTKATTEATRNKKVEVQSHHIKFISIALLFIISITIESVHYSSSISLISIAMMEMFLSLENSWTLSEPKSDGAS